MEVRAEYKKTEFGIVPNDWNIHTIQSLIDKKYIIGHLDGNHGELYPKSHEFKDSGTPYVSANDFLETKVNFKNCKYLSIERALTFKKGIAKSGDVLFAHNATVGPTVILKTDLDFVILSTTATYFRCDFRFLSNEYLLYAFKSHNFISQYQAVMSQSTRNQVPITAQRKLKVLIPNSITEQNAIAEVLSDADALIESLENLIEKKRQIKQGTMQELLTGKKRLPGFSDEWEEKTVSQLGEVVTGGTPSTQIKDYWGGEHPWVTPTDITSNRDMYSSERLITEGGLKAIRRLPPDTVLVTCIASIGKNAILKTIGACNQQINALIPNSANSATYLYYLFELNKQYFLSKAGITATLIISKNIFQEMTFVLPEVDEQEKIAEILIDMDSELSELESKLTKARQIKQGMMQELFTGRIRLV